MLHAKKYLSNSVPFAIYILLAICCIHGQSVMTAKAAEIDRPARPNIIIIITDDQGYGDVSTYHPSDVQTPFIDGIAKDGMLFTNMRANCTVCSPSRAAILTGLHPDRAGVPGVIRTDPENSWGYLSPSVTTLADHLKQLGYATAAIGKWHLGLTSPNTPNERGFDYFHGFLGDMMDSYLTHLRHGNNYMRLNDQEINPDGHATDLFADWASDYLRQRQQTPEQPFFLYLAFNAPHFPIEPPAEWLKRVQERDPSLSEARAKNVAFVEHLDDRIGKVLKTLQDIGLEENTLLAFTSDNGGSLPHAQNNDPWRDGKQSHYDGGLRVPFMIRWPSKVSPGTISEYEGQTFDLFPTAIEAAGGNPESHINAVSLMPIFENKSLPSDRTLYFVRREGGRSYGGLSYHAVIQDGWKLMQNSPFSPLELYNLTADPGEQHDVISSAPQIAGRLLKKMQQNVQLGGKTGWQDRSHEE